MENMSCYTLTCLNSQHLSYTGMSHEFAKECFFCTKVRKKELIPEYIKYWVSERNVSEIRLSTVKNNYIPESHLQVGTMDKSQGEITSQTNTRQIIAGPRLLLPWPKYP